MQTGQRRSRNTSHLQGNTMSSIRRELVGLIKQGAIPHDEVAQAVVHAGLYPSGRAWSAFLDRLLLWLGALALVCGVLFFIAYNWVEMGRWLRFGLVQAALVVAIGVYGWRQGREQGQGQGKREETVARVALLAAVLLLGVLLALFGQVYQTGADPWQLFFFWALLMLPWTLVARFDVLWMVWLGLLNLALVLYWRTWGSALDVLLDSDISLLLGLFVLNSVALALWELGARRWEWLKSAWAPRLLALASGVPVSMLTIALLDGTASPLVLIYPVWLAVLYGIYRHWRPDLFMLAGGCLSLIAVVTLFIARELLWQAGAGGFLLLAVVVLALGAAAVFWLRRLNGEMSA